MSATSRLARRQIQRAPGKVVAILLATILSALAIMTTGTFIETMQRGLTIRLAAPISNTDVVITGAGLDEQLPRVVADPGVASAELAGESVLFLTSIPGDRSLHLQAITDDPQMRWFTLADGTLPQTPHEALLSERTAAELGLAIGDTFAGNDLYSSGDPGVEVESTFTVSGIAALPEGTDTGDLLGLLPAQALASSPRASILVRTDGADASDVVERLNAEFAAQAAPDDFSAPKAQLTSTYVNDLVDTLSGSTGFLATIFLSFVAVALVAAIMVIRNTYQVLLAQRLRQSGLLRLVGATGAQLRSTVLLESLFVSTVGALVGVGAGFLLGWGIAAAVGLAGGGPSFPMLWAIGAIIVTVLVTLFAAYAPAAAAGRLAPVAALTSAATTERLNAGRSTAKWVVGLLFTLAGAVGIALGALGGGLLVAIPAGIVLAFGLVILIPLLLVAIMPAVARGFSLGGPISKLAGENLVRTARRSGTIVLAIAFGGSLVVAMLTAISTASASLDKSLSQQYAADAVIATSDGAPLTDAQIAAISSIAGVEEATAVRTIDVATDAADVPMVTVSELPSAWAERAGIDPNSNALFVTASVVDPDQGGPLAGVPTLELAGAHEPITLPVEVSIAAEGLPGPGNTIPAVVTAPVFAELGGSPQTNQLWLDIAPEAAHDVDTQLKEVFSENSNLVIGEALETRSLFEQVAGFLTAFVLAMLSLTIIISAIGLASVVALSVTERRRELGLLRAVGVDRGGVRTMVFLESLALALLGAVLSLIIGIPLGIAATMSAMVSGSMIVVALPWFGLGAVIVVAATLGIVAAIGPAQRAGRVSPAEALAHE